MMSKAEIERMYINAQKSLEKIKIEYEKKKNKEDASKIVVGRFGKEEKVLPLSAGMMNKAAWENSIAIQGAICMTLKAVLQK